MAKNEPSYRTLGYPDCFVQASLVRGKNFLMRNHGSDIFTYRQVHEELVLYIVSLPEDAIDAMSSIVHEIELNTIIRFSVHMDYYNIRIVCDVLFENSIVCRYSVKRIPDFTRYSLISE